MRKKLIILFLIVFNFTFSQNVTIQGVAISSKKEGYRIEIIVNDTLNRIIKSGKTNYPDYEELYYDENFRTTTDKNQKFQINAKLSDSLFFKSYDHITKSFLVRDLLKMESIKIVLNPEPCIEYVECEEKPQKLYVFIGEKINVDYSEEIKYCDIILSDTKYDAEYKILKNLYGNFPRDTIKFVSYDHASRIRYDEFETVLLYVTEYCGDLIHVKYQYHDLYKTVDGKWASPLNTRNYRNIGSDSIIKPRKIEFKKPIEIEYNEEQIKRLKKKFPEYYFEIKNGKVKILYGNYPEELFKLKKMTVLKKRGFFE